MILSSRGRIELKDVQKFYYLEKYAEQEMHTRIRNAYEEYKSKHRYLF